MVGAGSIAIGARFSAGTRKLLGQVRGSLSSSGLWLAWLVAAIATSGSLYYSEVARFTPCELCWYQRIFMYPLVLIIGVAAIKRDASVRRYVLPPAGVGSLISLYHYQLERFPTQSAYCDVEVPCTLTWVWEFNYISIPFMALSAFALIITLILLIPQEPAGGIAEPDREGRERGKKDTKRDA